MEIVAVAGNFDILVRLVIALVLGGLLGVERSMAHKTAGMRTYSLISMASAVLIIMSEIVIRKYTGTSGIDPLRMASAIIQSIGFVGAGLFFSSHLHSQPQPHITGITTAVGLWVSTGVGIAVGYGLYGMALIVTFLTLFVFSIMWVLEEKVVELSDEKLYLPEDEHPRSVNHKVSSREKAG